MKEEWYRFTDLRGSDRPHIYCNGFLVVKHTPKGVWVDEYGKQRFVLNDARRRYCYPTKELAWESFKSRKQWQESHARGLLDHLEALKEITSKPFEDTAVVYLTP